MAGCIVHDQPTPDYDSRGPWDFEPTVEQLTADYIAHLNGTCDGYYCDECYTAWQVRTLTGGIEEVNLEDDHTKAEIAASCTCQPQP